MNADRVALEETAQSRNAVTRTQSDGVAVEGESPSAGAETEMRSHEG